MREIKFRAWDKDAKKWHESEYLMLVINTIGYVFEVGDEGAGWEQNKRFEIQQYTGLKDKNGKEIYEGDVLGFPRVQKEPEVLGVIKFDEDLGNIVINKTNGGWSYLGDYLLEIRVFEVIGNIYENPELLNPLNH